MESVTVLKKKKRERRKQAKKKLCCRVLYNFSFHFLLFIFFFHFLLSSSKNTACLSSDGLGGCTQLEGLCMESPAHCTVTRSPPSLSTSILSRHSAITDPLAMVSRAEQAGHAVACSAQQNCPRNSMLCSAHPQHFMLMQCLTESCGSSAATRRVVGHEEGCGEGQQPAW